MSAEGIYGVIFVIGALMVAIATLLEMRLIKKSIKTLVADKQSLREALAPFATMTSDDNTIRITFTAEDIQRARAVYQRTST